MGEATDVVTNLLADIVLPQLHDQVRAQVFNMEDEKFYSKVKYVLNRNRSSFRIEFKKREDSYSAKEFGDKRAYVVHVSLPESLKTVP